MKELYYIRGNKENGNAAIQALLDKGGTLDDNLIENDLYYIDNDGEIKAVAEYGPIGQLLIYYGIELKPNKLYYIIGNKTNPEGVKQALLDKGAILNPNFNFDCDKNLYYIGKSLRVQTENILTYDGKLIQKYGIELQPVEIVEPEETFEPFDKVIIRFRNEGDWVVDTFSHKKGKWFYCSGGISYTECHKYEQWMNKYLGTNTPFEEFKKD